MTKSARPASIGPNGLRKIHVAEADAAAAERLLSLLAEAGRGSEGRDKLADRAPSSTREHQSRAHQEAVALLALRHNRLDVLGRRLGAEPAFLILLAIYVSDRTSVGICVTQVGEIAALSGATLLRWLDELQKAKWIARKIDENDRRRSHVMLTQKGRHALDTLFSRSLCESPSWND